MRRLIAIISLLACLLMPQTVSAYALFDNACTGVDPSSATCNAKNKPEQVYGSGSILSKITNLVSLIAGIASVLLIIISGLFFVLADGDAGKIKGAKNTLLGAVVGIVIVVASQSILKFVLSRI